MGRPANNSLVNVLLIIYHMYTKHSVLLWAGVVGGGDMSAHCGGAFSTNTRFLFRCVGSMADKQKNDLKKQSELKDKETISSVGPVEARIWAAFPPSFASRPSRLPSPGHLLALARRLDFLHWMKTQFAGDGLLP